jgi:hypothetical protein
MDTPDQVSWCRPHLETSLSLIDVWHDRAVFHFLTEPEDRRAYVRNVASAVKPGGHIIVGTYCRVESRAPAFFDSRNPCPTIPVCES